MSQKFALQLRVEVISTGHRIVYLVGRNKLLLSGHPRYRRVYSYCKVAGGELVSKNQSLNPNEVI